jgi:hypothetical protein
MARRTKRLVLGIVLVILSALVIVVVLPTRESEAEKAVRKIKVGMTYKEVSSILDDWMPLGLNDRAVFSCNGREIRVFVVRHWRRSDSIH